MKSEKKIWVDAHLNFVKDEQKAKAIVNYLTDSRVQIMFLEPIAHNMDVKEAVLACRKWVQKNYPKYYNAGRVVLATPEICMIANRGTFPVIITSCHTSRCVVCPDKSFLYRMYINKNGLPDYGSGRVKQKNVYATLVMSRKSFERLNPQINLEDYILEVPQRNPEF